MQEKLIEKAKQYLANTYTRFPIVVTKGEGCWLWDMDGRRYLDFLSGIAVCNLGHAPKSVAEGLSGQAQRLFHVSNLFYTEIQIRAAEVLVEHSFGDKVFFCNSGAEANEAAIKLARRYSWKKHGEGRADIIAMHNSFHGRTMATLSATGQTKFHVGFSPLLEGFSFVPFNDSEALKSAVSERTCAIILELVQSEGGVYVADREYIKFIRELAGERDILLILDEVQTAIGRTGRLFGYEHYNIKPDIVSLAKALGGGFPVGAILATEEAASGFEPGTHASTFGGNALASSAIVATMNTLLGEGVIANCEKMGRVLVEGLLSLKRKFPVIRDVRGMGLLLGVELSVPGEPLVQEFLKEGVILYATKGNVLRLLPPLVIDKEEVDLFLDIAARVFERQKS
ncbi:MAG TPA: aspartate aminotransferase family protein [Syntrophorhabdales bacterium]|nr:aspartate aminotransferase family protein [Syntrophorhabdales bacterium]